MKDLKVSSFKITAKTLRLQAGLAEAGVETSLKVSTRGVPHLYGNIDADCQYSICWMGRSRTWRLFYPYNSFVGGQTKTDHKTLTDLIAGIKALK